MLKRLLPKSEVINPIREMDLKRLRNWLLFLLVVLIWGSNWAVMKRGLSYIGPLNFVFHRFILSALFLSPLLIFLKRKIPNDKETLAKLLLLATINVFSMVSTNIGLVYEKSGISAILTYTQPLFVFCLAVPFLNKEARVTRLLGVTTGFSGVVVLSIRKLSSFESFSFSIFLLIIGAFLWAVTIVYYKKLLGHVDPVVTNIFQLAVGAGLLVCLASVSEGLSFPLVQEYTLIIFYISFFASSIALTLWVYLLREEEATVLSSSSFMIPIAALFFGWLMLGENPELMSFLGVGLIMAGVCLVNRS